MVAAVVLVALAARQAPDDIRETVETRPTSLEGTAAVSYKETLRTVGRNVSAMGTWATDKVFAKSFGNEINFRLGGSEASEIAWRLPLPARSAR